MSPIIKFKKFGSPAREFVNVLASSNITKYKKVIWHNVKIKNEKVNNLDLNISFYLKGIVKIGALEFITDFHGNVRFYQIDF